MGKFLRNLTSFLGGGPADQVDAPCADPLVATPPASAPAPKAAVEPETVASTDPAEPVALPIEQRALPLVTYAAPRDALALGKPRRARAIGLLRGLPGTTITTRTLPTLPSVATRLPAGVSAPLLTETERIRLQVMQTQIKLSVLHLYEGPIDGHLSAATMTAVRHFQTLKGMRPTGTLAAGTLAALGVPPVA